MSFLSPRIQKSIGRARGFNREITKNSEILIEKIQQNLDRLCDYMYNK